MIGVPVNSNSVYVSMVQTGCLKAEFDSTYPIHLNGIIGQDEYRESINRINRTLTSNKSLIFLAIVFALSIMGGMIFFIVGGITSTNSRTYGISPFIIVGILLTTFGSIFFSTGCCIVQFRRAARIRQAIAEESMKYSSRSPIPCSWRLDTTRNYFGGYRYHNNSQLVNHLVIDIGRPNIPGNQTYYSNQGANGSVSFSGQQNYAPPPPYSGQSTGYCLECNAPRHDLTARFCSSCGKVFNKY